MIKMVEHGGHVNGLDVEDVTDQEEPVDAASARRVDDTFIDNPTTPFGDVPCQLLPVGLLQEVAGAPYDLHICVVQCAVCTVHSALHCTALHGSAQCTVVQYLGFHEKNPA